MKRLPNILLMVLAFVVTSCTTNELDQNIEPNGALPKEMPEELYVTLDNDGVGDTRIQLNEECKTVWTEDDLVSVFYFSDANNKFLFMGDTGDRSGALVVEENRLADATTDIDKVVLLYPYSDDYSLNATTKSVAVQIPATQYYQNGSYGVGANLMVSVGTTNDFALRSVCGWIEIQLTGTSSVTSVTLTGNDKEQLAGDATLYYDDLRLALLGEDGGPDDNSQVGGSLFFGEYVRTITLDCSEGVALNRTTPTSFYFVLAPQTFDEGITITATLDDGTTITKSTSKAITVSRNTISPMSSFGVQAANEIWYKSSDGAVVTPYKTDVFGANIVSNTYENGKGVIKFDGDVTTIGERAFFNRTSLTSITIPDSVTSIGEYAFYNCTSLTSITIPDSVTSIIKEAFIYCSSLEEFKGKYASEDGRCIVVDGRLDSFAPAGLTEYTIPDGVTSIGSEAFRYCASLTSITIPNSVTSIGNYAFSGCESLASITIPDGVTEIGDYAFWYCSSLTSVYCKCTTPPTGNSSMFSSNASGRKIYVPTASVEAYKAASYWRDYADYIVGYNF